MALSGGQRTRNAVGGSGQAYPGFAAKEEEVSFPVTDRFNTTRNAVGGSGRPYLGFTAKEETAIDIDRFNVTRNAAGGPGRPYLTLGGFAAKEEYIPQKFYIEISDGVAWLLSTKEIVYKLN